MLTCSLLKRYKSLEFSVSLRTENMCKQIIFFFQCQTFVVLALKKPNINGPRDKGFYKKLYVLGYLDIYLS